MDGQKVLLRNVVQNADYHFSGRVLYAVFRITQQRRRSLNVITKLMSLRSSRSQVWLVHSF